MDIVFSMFTGGISVKVILMSSLFGDFSKIENSSSSLIKSINLSFRDLDFFLGSFSKSLFNFFGLDSLELLDFVFSSIFSSFLAFSDSAFFLASFSEALSFLSISSRSFFSSAKVFSEAFVKFSILFFTVSSTCLIISLSSFVFSMESIFLMGLKTIVLSLESPILSMPLSSDTIFTFTFFRFFPQILQ